MGYSKTGICVGLTCNGFSYNLCKNIYHWSKDDIKLKKDLLKKLRDLRSLAKTSRINQLKIECYLKKNQ